MLINLLFSVHKIKSIQFKTINYNVINCSTWRKIREYLKTPTDGILNPANLYINQLLPRFRLHEYRLSWYARFHWNWCTGLALKAKQTDSINFAFIILVSKNGLIILVCAGTLTLFKYIKLFKKTYQLDSGEWEKKLIKHILF